MPSKASFIFESVKETFAFLGEGQEHSLTLFGLVLALTFVGIIVATGKNS